MDQDRIEIEILDDGSLKVYTGSLAGPNHVSADNFIRDMQRLAGGDTETEKRKHSHSHAQERNVQKAGHGH